MLNFIREVENGVLGVTRKIYVLGNSNCGLYHAVVKPLLGIGEVRGPKKNGSVYVAVKL